MSGTDDRADGSGGGGSFLSRWSRRKAEARVEETKPAEVIPSAEEAADAVEIDPETLPPVESLTPESDFTVFLKKGVPPALRSAALRKLWLTEPSVVNYEPLVEYNWDFTAPGYGDLLPTDDIAKFAKQVIEGTPRATEAEAGTETEAVPQAQTPAAAAAEPEAAAGIETAAEDDIAAIEPPAEDAGSAAGAETQPQRRRHGGALPG